VWKMMHQYSMEMFAELDKGVLIFFFSLTASFFKECIKDMKIKLCTIFEAKESWLG
jgi:hypothetical protein